MSRRSILISLAVINIAIIAAVVLAVVWRQHTNPSMVLNSRLTYAGISAAQLAEFGLIEGITPSEVQDATNILVQERRMWSRFNGMSADMSVEFDGNDGKRFSLEGDVTLHRLDLSPNERAKFIAKYEMTISNKQDGWTVTTDGTSKNTVITCQDPRVLGAIRAISPSSLFHLLTFPQYVTAVFYRDEFYPHEFGNPYTLNQFLRIWEPWLMTNAAPHSYTFFGMEGDRYGGRVDFTFKSEHINRWRKTEAKSNFPVVETLAIYFENPVESNGFWYPTVIRMTPAPTPWPYPNMDQGWFIPLIPPAPAKGKGQLCITLSNVSVHVR